MPIGSAQDMLRQLQQQLQNPNFGANFMQQLQNAGLGAQNPSQFYGTPFDEQFLRQSVLGRVLGYYGMPNAGTGIYNNVGNPNALLGGQMNIDPFTGGAQNMPAWAQAGYGDKSSWKQAGRPTSGGPLQTGLGGNPIGIDLPNIGQGGTAGGFLLDQNMGGGMQNPDFYGQMQNYNPQVSALGADYPEMFGNALQAAMSNTSGGGGGFSGFPFPPNFSGGGIGLPPLDQATQDRLNQMYQSQLGNMNLDYEKQKQDMINQLYGRGVNASTIAADTAGRLNYGRQEAINQLFANQAQNTIDIQKALLDAQTARMKAGGGGGIGSGSFLGGFYNGMPIGGFQGPVNNTGGDLIGNLASQLTAHPDQMQRDQAMAIQNVPQGLAGQSFGNRAQGSPVGMNMLQAMTNGRSTVPLTFDQQMQLAQLQLQQAGLAQQGQLGFGGLGLQRELGLGSQGLQGQNLAQDFMSQLLGMGLSRQQGAANFTQNDLARMQQYLQNQSNQFTNIGQQNAQLEAQRRSFMSQLMGGLLGGASALLPGLGQISQAGGFGQVFSDLFH